jgi:hypothetical protein
MIYMARLLRLVLMLEAGRQLIPFSGDLVRESVHPGFMRRWGYALKNHRYFARPRRQLKGDETFRPSLVNSTGISSPSPNASLHRRAAGYRHSPLISGSMRCSRGDIFS